MIKKPKFKSMSKTLGENSPKTKVEQKKEDHLSFITTKKRKKESSLTVRISLETKALYYKIVERVSKVATFAPINTSQTDILELLVMYLDTLNDKELDNFIMNALKNIHKSKQT